MWRPAKALPIGRGQDRVAGTPQPRRRRDLARDIGPRLQARQRPQRLSVGSEPAGAQGVRVSVSQLRLKLEERSACRLYDLSAPEQHHQPVRVRLHGGAVDCGSDLQLACAADRTFRPQPSEVPELHGEDKIFARLLWQPAAGVRSGRRCFASNHCWPRSMDLACPAAQNLTIAR